MRTKTPGDGAKWLTWAQKMANACEKNEGISVMTNVDLGVHGAVGFTSQLKAGSDTSFTSIGQRGDLVVMVSNANSDGTEVGVTTTKYVLNHIDDLISRSK